MSDEIDTTRVKCPNGCLIQSGLGKTIEVPRQFKWCEEAKEDIGTRKYCENCGTKLIEAQEVLNQR